MQEFPQLKLKFGHNYLKWLIVDFYIHILVLKYSNL